MSLRQAGHTKSVAKLHVRQAGSTKTAIVGHIRQSGALKTFFEELGVSLSDDNVSGVRNSAGSVSVSSSPVTAIVSGGAGTLTYSWTRTAPDAQPWTINSASSATTVFKTTCAADTSYTATFHCTITDGLGLTVTSGTVTATCSNDYFGGGGGGPYP